MTRLLVVLITCLAVRLPAEPSSLSGIYPQLAMFNDEGECGTGAVVPWAGRLWVVSYAPHMPQGSTDKLYEITPDLRQVIRPESVGGTPANRLIHRESQQLFIGPYVIDTNRNVRVIPPAQMYGRLTGNARHLVDPVHKIYYATMEEGIYEVDVSTLAVTELWRDEQLAGGQHADLPGYHGKGLYSGQGRLVYANNGEHGSAALSRPDVPSGVLASWDGRATNWSVVRRNQFTDVTGPGGIHGATNPETDPLWSIGWDHRSLILMVMERGRWHAFRLPKSSSSYDGAHGWNTEWPRIRDIGEPDLLMTMHGAFWRFPKNFSPTHCAGLVPRACYLKVIGDFCRWNDRLVFGCDDTAKNEFLNKRKAKGQIAAPQSQSNLWFLSPDELDELGPVLGQGGVWLAEDIPAHTLSDPLLVAGYARRGLHLAHQGSTEATIVLEVDEHGDGHWRRWREVNVSANGYQWLELPDNITWLRASSPQPLKQATVWFAGANLDPRSPQPDPIFAGLATVSDKAVRGGMVRANSGNTRTLSLVVMDSRAPGALETGCYEMDGDLRLRQVTGPAAVDAEQHRARIPAGVLETDAASVIFTDDAGRRWRLPRGDAGFDQEGPLGPSRVDREVATERDLFNAHGTFYELPAENAGGFAKVRPVATHNLRIHDYCSYRGLFVMTGVQAEGLPRNPHLIQAEDGKAVLWAGAIDDIWKLGKPRGAGGPWKQTPVRAGRPSDPYLFTGYDRKSVTLSHESTNSVTITLQVDFTGTGLWVNYQSFTVAPRATVQHQFPAAYAGSWLRAVSDTDTVASVQLTYD